MSSAWVRLDADFHAHPKVLEVGLAGAGLFAAALAYCGDYRTDGLVPAAWVNARVAGDEDSPRDLPERLQEAGLWRLEGKAYTIRDFLELNLSKAEWEELTEARSRAGKAGARARWGGKSNSKSHSKSDGKTMARERVREHDGAKAPSNPPEGDSVKGQVEQVYAYWRHELGRPGARLKPTPKVAGHIRARLEGDHTVADLRQVVDIVAGSKWHRDNGHTGAALLFRSDDQVDGYLQRAVKSSAGGPAKFLVVPQSRDVREQRARHLFPDLDPVKVANAMERLARGAGRRVELETIRRELQ